jgi:hypothetical protein
VPGKSGGDDVQAMPMRMGTSAHAMDNSLASSFGFPLVTK